MTLHSRQPQNKKIQINLSNPEGNAFALMKLADSLGRKLGLESSDIESIIKDMKSSDFDHLVSVLDKHFGDYVDIYKS